MLSTNSPVLNTDHYEYTALGAALESGAGARRATFELFARRLPPGRRYGVVAGVDRAIAAIVGFRFDDGVLEWLCTSGIISTSTARHLRAWRFKGDVVGYQEGELFFPGSPVLTVSGTFADAVLLETVLLSIYNHDSAVAAAAARMHSVARGRRLIDGGSRRVHENAAVDAARAAFICGVDATSNLAAGRRYGVPTAGTTMHAFVLAHTTEREAFDAQVASLGTSSSFLVDTYDTPTGVRNAVGACRAAGGVPGAVRIDSGDLREVVRAVRIQLDSAGCHDTKIIVSGDLDEFHIDALANQPVDGYLVGTELHTGSGAPTAKMVYKLVSVADSAAGPERPVAKRAPGKVSHGGRKTAWRSFDEAGFAACEHVSVTAETPPSNSRPLNVPLIVGGEVVWEPSLTQVRDHHLTARAELSPEQLNIQPGDPAVPTVYR